MNLFKYLVYQKNTTGVEMGISKEPINTLVAGFMEKEDADEYVKQQGDKSSHRITYYIKDAEKEV